MILTEIDATYEKLKVAVKSRESLKTIVTAFLALIKRSGIKDECHDVFMKWYKIASELHREAMNALESNEPTERQQLAAVSWVDVEEVLKRLDTTKYGSKEHVLLSMHVKLAMRRQEDYARVYVYQDASDDTPKDTHDAYIDLTVDEPYIEIMRYKTIGTHDVFREILPCKLVDVIRYSLKKEPRQYLMTKKNGDAYGEDTKAYTKYVNYTLKKLFDNPHVSLNSLRHARATWSRENNFAVRDQRAEARRMGHKLDMHHLYAKKA
jgi:hypothetical protein